MYFQLLGWGVVALGLFVILISVARIVVYLRNSKADDSRCGKIVGFIRGLIYNPDNALVYALGGFVATMIGTLILAGLSIR